MGSNGGYIGHDATPKGDGRAPGVWGLRDVYLARLRGTWPFAGVPVDILRWYDASQIPGLADADPVSQWNDLSINADHAVQAASANQPSYRTGVINGLPVVRFDGGDILVLSELFDSSAADAHIFVVADLASGTNGTILTTRGSSTTQGWGLRHNNATQIEYYHGGYSPTATKTITDQFNILEVKRDGLSIQIGDNGTLASAVSISNYAASGYNKTSIGAENDGATNPLTGDIAEIVIYDRLLETSERDGLLAHLSGKYAITLP